MLHGVLCWLPCTRYPMYPSTCSTNRTWPHRCHSYPCQPRSNPMGSFDGAPLTAPSSQRAQYRLLSAAGSITDADLSQGEALRNRMGDILVFGHQLNSQEKEFCTSTLPKVRPGGAA